MGLMLCQNKKMDIQLILLFMVILERSSYAKTIN
jgi:hypothetical protein